MALPNAPLRTNPALASLSVMFGPIDADFVADRIFRTVDVSTKTGRFHEFLDGFAEATSDNDFDLAQGQDRPDVISNRSILRDGWHVRPRGRGINNDVTYAQFAAGEGVDEYQVNAMRLRKLTQILRERSAAAIAFDAATTFASYTTAVPAASKFDTATANPQEYVDEIREDVADVCGIMPNCATIGRKVFRKLKQNADLRDRRNAAGDSVMSPDEAMVAAYLGLDRVYVCRAVSNTAGEGLTASKSPIWTETSMLLHYEAPAEVAMAPNSTLLRFRLAGTRDGAPNVYPLPGNYQERMDMVWVEQFAAPKPETGHLLTAVVS